MRWLLALVVAVGVFSGLYFFKDSFKYRTAPSKFAEGRTGVTHYDRWRAQDGYNLVTYFVRPGHCRLLDMKGKILREFTGTFCHFRKDGGVTSLDGGPFFFDHNLNLVWQKTGEGYNQHHDSSLDPADESIFFLNNQFPQIGGRKVTANEIVGYSKTGQRIFEWKMLDHLPALAEILKRSLAIQYVEAIQENIVLHLNTLQVLGPNIHEDRWPAFRRGNLLTGSDRHNLIFIIDRETGKIVWHYILNRRFDTGQHSARLLENGNILYFSNNHDPEAENLGRAFSEVIELNPGTFKTEWRYQSDPAPMFYNKFFGSALRLSGGNTLITHTREGGSAFEVDRAGRIVWEWISPELDEQSGRPLPIYRVERVSQAVVERYLSESRSW